MPDLTTDIFPSLTTGSTTRGPSPSIWKLCPWLELPPYGFNRDGITEFDDFGTATAALTNAALSKYKVVGTTGTGVLQATDDGGVISMATGGTANNESMLVYGQTTGGLGQIISSSVNSIWFETRVRFSQIASGGYFIGLVKPADAASGLMVNATNVIASSSVNCVGFNVANATPTKLDIVYTSNAAPTTYKAAAQTLVANTWYKLGIRFNSIKHSQPNIVQFFINGLRVLSTASVDGVAASASNFPDSIMLTPIWAAKTIDTTNVNVHVDWWRYAQIIEDSTYG